MARSTVGPGWRGTGRQLAACAAILASQAAAACGGGHQLEEYTIAGKTLAVVDYPPPAPVIWTGSVDVDGASVITAVLDAGSRVAKEVEVREAQARLDSAANLVDVRDRMTRRTFERAARYLGARMVEDPNASDYLLEVYVQRFGIDAAGNEARVFMTVEAILLDRRSGHEVWAVEVDSHDRLTPSVRSASYVPADAVTAGALHTVTVEQLRLALAGLTDFTADYVANELREDLRDVRRD